MPEVAQQGHLYQYAGERVLAMESGAVVRVRQVEEGGPWLGEAQSVSATWLQPLPMRYFHGQVPRERGQ